jgi:hypothetical protein
MNDKMEAMRDDELNELFANHVCSYVLMPSLIQGAILCGVRGQPGTGTFRLPSFCTNANAVLPWLENWRTTSEHIKERALPWHVLCEDGEHCYVGRAATFPRAAVLAMLRARRGQAGETR